MGRLRNVFDVYWAVYLLCNPSSTLYRIEVLWQVFPLFINAKRDTLIEDSLSIKMDLLREWKRNKIMANFNTEYNNSTSTEALAQRVIPICFVFPQREICILYSWNLTIHLLSPTMLRMSFVWMKNWNKKKSRKRNILFILRNHNSFVVNITQQLFRNLELDVSSTLVFKICPSISVIYFLHPAFFIGTCKHFKILKKKILEEFIESK